MHTWRKSHTDPNRSLDKFYTKPEVAKKCLSEIDILPYEYDCVIEPSAGNGVFYEIIDHDNKIGIDIQPQHKNILKYNWFKYKIDTSFKKVLVVGNPPFGQYNKLSSHFIIYAMSFANVQTIAFILPNVYKKHTRQKILPHYWRIISITDLGKNCFTLNGKDYHVPTSFFIFDKSVGKDLRVNPNVYTETNDFEFSNEDDFDIFVFGSAPKKITKTPKPNNRGYFLKSKICVDELIRKIQSIEWKGHSSASGGVYWLTKFEFLDQYIKYYEPNRIEKKDDIYFRQYR